MQCRQMLLYLLAFQLFLFKQKQLKADGLLVATVKPVYNDHLGDEVSVVVLDR